MKGEKKNQFKALERIETPCFRKQRHGGRPRCPRATDRTDRRRHTAGCPAFSGHWLLTPALRNLSRRVLAGRVLHRTGSVAGGWGGRGGREPAWGGGRWGVGGRQPALTSQWWRQVSTINIAHRIGRGLGQRLGQQQGAGGAALYSRQPRLMGPWCTGLATSLGAWPGPAPSGVAGEVQMLFSQQALGRLSSSGAVTVAVPCQGWPPRPCPVSR